MVQTPHLRMTNAFRFMISSRSCLILQMYGGEDTGKERVSKACVAGTERGPEGDYGLSGKYGGLTMYMYTNHPFGIEV